MTRMCENVKMKPYLVYANINLKIDYMFKIIYVQINRLGYYFEKEADLFLKGLEFPIGQFDFERLISLIVVID